MLAGSLNAVTPRARTTAMIASIVLCGVGQRRGRFSRSQSSPTDIWSQLEGRPGSCLGCAARCDRLYGTARRTPGLSKGYSRTSDNAMRVSDVWYAHARRCVTQFWGVPLRGGCSFFRLPAQPEIQCNDDRSTDHGSRYVVLQQLRLTNAAPRRRVHVGIAQDGALQHCSSSPSCSWIMSMRPRRLGGDLVEPEFSAQPD
jgi:hypothetical protein